MKLLIFLLAMICPLSYADDAPPAEPPATPPPVEKPAEDPPAEPPKEDDIPEEEEEPPGDEPPSDADLVAQALEKEKALKEQLEALNTDSENVFERNAILEKKLEDAQKLAELEAKNKEMEGQLETIKRKSITDSLKLNSEMREFADGLSFDQLQVFAKNAPKMKTILQQKNDVSKENDIVKEFNKQHNKSRIHTNG
jgi:hypothetical protein